ncbi:hypothetical protein R5R35_004976 [Gryllus longicercus]|uniref:SAP domain-containing protein n=1 Tax=Gryllus longicercus TaxID=2509291 RepID=A0AAN9VI27_9ORTH
MPVSTGTGPSHADRAKRCRHCEESGHRLDNGTLFWRIHLDQDLFDTIIAIYPEWFKDYNVNRASTMAEGGSGSSGASPEPGPAGPAGPSPAGSSAHASRGPLPLSPPKAEVDESPLQKSMDKNKESLKVKLMLRRPINQLVAQGIMPPLKTPPAFHEQRQKLERAKMGDLLKAKIQQRPDRQELVRQHILEDVGHVDPSLAERQRMLKKARLADSLNDQLSHRPGPLELIKKNILHTEEPIERAVKEGVIPFKATSEGQVTKPQHPNRYITFEEDSQSSEGAQSPLQTQPSTSLPEVRSQPDVLEAAAASAGIVTVALTIPTAGGAVVVTSATPTVQHQSLTASPAHTVSVSATPIEPQPPQSLTFADLCSSVVGGTSHGLAPAPSPMSLGSTTSSLSPLSSISVSSPPAPPTPSPTVTITPRPAPQPSPISVVSSHRSDAPGKDKNRKKSKSKAQPKTRTIKFHEYKGPPNAHKSAPINASPVETSYELLLQQQQLFLQWQLEWQHKYPQIILPASQKPLAVSSDAGNSQQPTTPALSGLIAVTSPASAQHATSPVAHSPGAAQPATPAPALPTAQPSVPQSATPVPNQESSTPQSFPTFRTLTKLEDMKVSDLKAELKRRNLPVSGSKPQLIERLKPYSDASHQHDSQNNQNSQNNQTTTIPMSHMGHIIMDTHGSVMNEESLPGDTPVSPPSQQMSLTVENSIGEDDVSLPNLSPSSEQQQLSPLSPTMSPDGTADMEMDTSDGNLAASTLNSPAAQSSPPPQPPSPAQGQIPMSEDIIRDQQRKIEELQRELLRSQLQLKKIRSKELNTCSPVPQIAQKNAVPHHKLLSAGMTVNTTPNGIVIGPDLTPKQHQKMILQQHIQQKKQQQQLQQQIQALQQQQLQQPQQPKQTATFQQQQPQQQQQQQQSQPQQQQLEAQQKQSTQQQQQQPQQASPQQSHCPLQSPTGLSAKASLAAFLQNQSQQNQQLTNLLHQQNVASNNKNNNCPMASNNKKNMAGKSIVLGQQQAAIVLNQLNLQKQKTAAPNGVVGHQRTSSLPNFIGSFLNHQQQQAQSSVQASQPSDDNQKPTTDAIPRITNETLLIPKPPPQYEEATKQLKVKQEIPSDCATKANIRPKNVKSQMMDDVLEILIKNGELPPSAAQDPATPTTPGRSLPHGLIFTTSATATTTTTTTTSTVNGPVDTMVASPPAPPPPPPPPLPHTTFAITLPTSITLTSQQDNHESNTAPFQMQFTGTDTFEFLLGGGETSANSRSQTQDTNPGPALTSDLPPPSGIDLKELGLDLETLDSMDFGNFGDLCAPVKMPSPSHLLETVTDMEIGGSGDPVNDQIITPKEEMLHDQLMNQQTCEFMDIGEMPMDMDDPDWLESLMPTDQNANGNVESTSVMTPPHQSAFNIPPSTGSNYHFSHNNVDLDSYDPLLSNSQDPFDLFNIEDPDFKMSADLNALGWDKVDFAT